MVKENIFSEKCGFKYKWSSHALQRWKQRFNGIDRDCEFQSAERIGKKTKKMIMALTPVSSEIYMGTFKGRYLLLGRSKIVFVIESKGDSIITAFHLYGSDT